MLWNIQFYTATIAVFTIVAVQNVQSQTPVECTAYINDTEPNPPFAAVLKVNIGSRLKFVYKESDVNTSACHDKYKGWHLNNHRINHDNENEAPYNISVSVDLQEDRCVYELNMTINPSTDMQQSSAIWFQPSEDCHTYKICSRNVTANYILVILEDENSKQTTLPVPSTTQSTAPTSTSPLSTSAICPEYPPTISAIKDLQSNLSFQIESECKKFDAKWQYTLLGVQLLSLVVAFFTGIISTAIYRKLQPKQPINKPATQFLNPTYHQGVRGAMDTNLKAQSDNSLTQNINQEITHSHSSLTTDSH